MKNEIKQFISIEKSFKKIEMNDNNISNHAEHDRKDRIALANHLIFSENAKLDASFIVDFGHKNGKEIHNIYSNGVIKIYNYNTRRFITVLIGSFNQCKRYYNAVGISKYMPQEIEFLCNEHVHNHYNH